MSPMVPPLPILPLLILAAGYLDLGLSLSCFSDNGYTLEPTATNSVPQTPESLRDLRECSNQCMADPCCLSYGLKDGACETQPFRSHDLDYIKAGTCTGDCPDAATCTAFACPGEYGANGGEPYDFFPYYSVNRDEIRKVTLVGTVYPGSANEFLVGIGITFGESVFKYFQISFETGQLTEPLPTSPPPYECVLAPGEHIQEAYMYEDLLFGAFPVQSGLKFVTNLKTCGPYGSTSGTMRTFKGNKLLYMHGRLGMAFDKFAFVYDYCTA